MSPRDVNAEPLWKDEFSVHAADERYVSRRQFTKFLVLTSAAMLAGQLWIVTKAWFRRRAGGVKPPELAIAGVGEMQVGDVKLFTYPTSEDHCIMVRAADKFVAYSQKCTHLSCAVYYTKENNRLECPCHVGYFSVDDGSVLAGPPPRPLPRILLEKRGDELMAIGVHGA